jgi:NADH dehydrogenase
MPQRIFITGGSGFVGSAIIRQLLAGGYAVNALVNHKNLPDSGGDVRSFKGGLFDAAALQEAMRGCAAAIHVVGIIMGNPACGVTFQRIHFDGTRAVVEAAGKSGVERYLHMSALGTRAGANSEYHKTKWAAEEIARSSRLQWTIFRPSLIHGPQGEFMRMEAKWARKQAAPFLFMPYFGGGLLGLAGAGMLQPIYVEDVARAFVQSLGNPKTIGQTYGIAGSERLSWPQMHEISSRAIVGKKRLTVAIPAWSARLLTMALPAKLLPFNGDQVIMSQEDNTCDLNPFESDFGWTPRSFSEALKEYASKI